MHPTSRSIKVAIVDDEPLARARLRDLVSALTGYEIVGEASDGEDALELLDQTEPDVVLADVRMPGMDGLQLARRLQAMDTPPALIFTTAYPEHALSAIEAGAAAYLLKPVRREKLQTALWRASRITRLQQQAAPVSAPPNARREFLNVASRDGVARIPVASILYFLAEHKYTTVRHLHGEALLEKPLKELELQLAPDFLRIHRKILVAKRYVSALERSRDDESLYWLHLRPGGPALPVARRRLAEVRRVLDEDGA